MSLKVAWKNLVKALVFVLLFLIVFLCVIRLLSRKESVEKFGEFYQEADRDYDVIFLGSSQVYRSVNPMELWDEYGITSYCLAASASLMGENYWILKNALEYHTPRLVVVDVRYINLYGLAPDAPQKVHEAFDAIPLSSTKVDSINDIFETSADRLEYLFPFSTYHSRWTELTAEDFGYSYIPTKGAVLGSQVADFSDETDESVADVDYGHSRNLQYLESMIELCEENDIEIMLIKIPFITDAEQRGWAEAVHETADQYGLNYVNLLAEHRELTSLQCDYSDTFHMNVSGQSKLTAWLGEYLRDNYNLTDYRDDAEVAVVWNADYETYTDYKVTYLKSCSGDFTSYLVTLKLPHLNAKILIRSDSAYLDDSMVSALLYNLSDKCTISYVDEVDEDGSDALVTVYDDRTGEIIDMECFTYTAE